MRQKKRTWKFLFFVIVVLICIGSAVFIVRLKSNGVTTLAATSSQRPNQNNAPVNNAGMRNNSQPATSGQTNPSVNVVTQAALKFGVFSCIKRINQVASFLTLNNKSSVFVFTPQSPADSHVFSTSFELIRPDDTTLYASASFFPNSDAVYDTVEYVDKSCEQLQQSTFKHLQNRTVLKENIIMLDAGAVKVFLMPAGGGSIVIKKEVVK